MWDDIIRGQFEVRDLNAARLLHGYLLQDKYVWFYSGTDYSGVCVAFDKQTLCNSISRTIAKNLNEYGCSLDVTIGERNYNSASIDLGGCATYKGTFLHYSQILEAIIPNE